MSPAGVGSRECARCDFSGPETEFIAAGVDRGCLMLMHRNDAPPDFVLICCGCAAGIGKTDPEVVRGAVLGLVAAALRRSA